MAFAVHERMLTETDLKRHAEEAMEQARLSEAAAALGLGEKVEIFGPTMKLEFEGSRENVAALVESSAERGVRFDHAGAVEGEEHAYLSKKVGHLIEVRAC